MMNSQIRILFLCICLFFSILAKSQLNNTSTLQVEILGAYNLAGVSLDQRFSDDYAGLGFKAGVGVGYVNSPWTFIPFKYNTWGGFPKNEIVSVPLQINYLLGKRNSQFEIGAGITPFYSTYKFNGKSHINAYGTLATGYRYHNLKRNLAFGAGIMYGFKLPGLKLNYVDDLFWQPYLSIGYIIN
ncbi:MAG: hypothetical protein GXZ19_13485 [Bacteroidales bacterium]|nr:hypothetical protein [Bacteroidales bacterium]